MAIRGSASAASRVCLHRLQVHAGERADDLQVAEFLGADVHQQVFARGIFAIEALDGVLHGGGEFAVGAAELLQQHIAERGIGRRRRGRCTSIS